MPYCFSPEHKARGWLFALMRIVIIAVGAYGFWIIVNGEMRV